MIQLVLLLVAGEQTGACTLYGTNYDHGQDYMSWTGVSSLRRCQDKCKTTYNCNGITWVKNSWRNCALYDRRGTQSGVRRNQQDSYMCNSGGTPNFISPGSSDEGTCSRSRPPVPGVFCLNERDRISCRTRSDCPKDYTAAEYDQYGSYTIRVEHDCADLDCFDYDVDCEPQRECTEQIYNPNLFTIGGDYVTTSSSTVAQSALNVVSSLARFSRCPNSHPCSYPRNRCGKVVGLGRGGKEAGCPKRPSNPIQRRNRG